MADDREQFNSMRSQHTKDHQWIAGHVVIMKNCDKIVFRYFNVKISRMKGIVVSGIALGPDRTGIKDEDGLHLWSVFLQPLSITDVSVQV